MHACLEDGTAIKGSAPEAVAKAFHRDKSVKELRARIRDLERAISVMLDVRGEVVKALRRVAAM